MTAPMAKPNKGNRCCQCGTSVPGDELYCNRCGPRHLLLADKRSYDVTPGQVA